MNIEADISDAEICEYIATLKHEETEIINKNISPKVGIATWWQCPIKEVQPVFYSSIYRGSFQYTPSDLVMVIYDCDGLMALSNMTADYSDDIYKAIDIFLKRCISEGLCIFAVSADDIFIGMDNDMNWRVYIKGVMGRSVFIMGDKLEEAHSIISDLDKSGAIIKPLEVWVLWMMIHEGIPRLTMSVFDKAVSLYRTVHHNNGENSYKALWGEIGSDLDTLLHKFWTPEWQIWWGPQLNRN